MKMSDEGIIIGILAAFAGFFILLFVVGIIFYILYAIGMYSIAKKEGKEDLAWLAWIPLANLFLVPILVENDVHEDVRGKMTLIFGVTFAVSFVVGFFFTPVMFLYVIVFLYSFYFLALKYSKNAVVHLIIAIVTFSASVPISVFRFRNR